MTSYPLASYRPDRLISSAMDQRDTTADSAPKLNGAGNLNTGILNTAGTKDIDSILAAALKNSIALAGIESVTTAVGSVDLKVKRPEILSVIKTLKEDPRFDCKLIVDITVVDWIDSKPERFEVVYHVYSVTLKHRFRIKVVVPENDAKIDSIVSVYAGANFMEREAWDMYGVSFTNHPDLRRILMYDEFQGHPLKKDYPVQGKQPRIPLRSPEVRNTALDLKRGDLVQITRRQAV